MNNVKLAFDDVLLKPQYSDIESRSLIDISNNLYAGYTLEVPIIASPMDTVSETDMAIAMHRAEALAWNLHGGDVSNSCSHWSNGRLYAESR